MSSTLSRSIIRSAAMVALLPVLALVPARAAIESGIAPGYPEQIMDLDLREVAMLPRYCPYTQVFRDRVPGGNDANEIQRWSQIMGPVFHALHHYCQGLMDTNRALFIARTSQYKKFYLEASIVEFDYVLFRAAPDFVLMPEILTKKGENLLRLGRAQAGITQLEQAITVKRDYWPPYAVLSDYYKSAGQIDRAREVLEKGLSLSPEAKGLKTRLAGLRSGTEKRKSSE